MLLFGVLLVFVLSNFDVLFDVCVVGLVELFDLLVIDCFDIVLCIGEDIDKVVVVIVDMYWFGDLCLIFVVILFLVVF